MAELKKVDCRGLACPQPVLDTKAALEGATSRFVVIVDNESSATNVQRFAESQGARATVAREGADLLVSVEPGDGPRAAEAPPVVCVATASSSKNLVVYVSSEGMGRGDEELGHTLMAAFLDTLSHFQGAISHVVFVNAGAKLAVQGSPVLDQIRQLEQLGAHVLVCGTCLNFFGLKDRLAVGGISNMYAIIETLAGAGRIIRP